MIEADELAAIASLIADGEDREAFTRLRSRLGWPRGKQLTDLTGWLDLLAQLAATRGVSQVVDLSRAAVLDPDSPDKLFALGYALIDSGAASIAASVLWRCLQLVGDSEEVVCELVSALESALAYNDAFAILEEHASLRGRSFICEYLYAFNAAMTGRLDITRNELARLVPDSEETESMRATITAIIERADRVAGVCSLDTRDLRGWHYVLTGSVLQHQSPYGFDEPMHGRYAWLRDSIERIATGLLRFAPLVRGTECVYAPPIPLAHPLSVSSHEILGRALARMLGVPFVPWPAVGVPAPGVIVLYDLTELPPDDVTRLLQRRPGQVLYAHASPWTQDFPIAPDVTTVLYQSLVAPWDGTTSVDTIINQITTSAGLEADETAADELVRLTALVQKAWPPLPGQRSRLWAGGPVPSNRFD